MTDRRKLRNNQKGEGQTIRMSPKTASSVSEYRRASIQEQVDAGLLKEGVNYEALQTMRQRQSPSNKSGGIQRGTWERLDKVGVSAPGTKGTVAVAHSSSYKSGTPVGGSLYKTANVLGGGGTGAQGASGVDQLVPEVYSPLFTMANLNLPRDRITINSWIRSFFDLHPVVRNVITLHATYPISKLNIKCPDKTVLHFFEDMLEEMDILEVVGGIALEWWKHGEKIQGSSLITMADGTLKPITDIQVGDYVLTHLGNKKKVLKKFIKPTNKVIEEHLKVYKVHTLGLPDPLIISGRHPILTSKLENFMCSTPSCKKKGMRILPGKERCGNCRKKYNNSSILPDFVEMNDVKEKDLVYCPFNSDVAENESFNEDLCYLMGIWLAEGSYCKSKRKDYIKYNGIKITNYDLDFINTVENSISTCFGEVGANYTSKSTHLNVGADKYDYWFCAEKRGGPQIADFFFKHLGEYSKTKKLSEEVMLLPPELQKYIIAGFIKGDGCIDKSNGHAIICSSSKDLANQFILILRRLGFHPTYTKVRSKMNGELKGFNYRISLPPIELNTFENMLKHKDKNNMCIPAWSCPRTAMQNNWQVSHINKIEDITDRFYEDYMYDIEVEDDHSYIANGIAIHNCFPYAELDDDVGKWKRVIIQNPDFINVKKSVLAGEPVISLRPDQVLQRLILSNNPADAAIKAQIPEQIIYHVRRGENIPLDNFNISHLKMTGSPYDVRGTSVIVSVFKDLMLYDKLRECFQADTEFLTENGFKKYHEITETDKLGTYNSNTNELEFQNYIDRIEKKYEGEMYHFHGKKIDVSVTPGHRMWLSQSKSHGGGYYDYNFVEAKNVKGGYFYKSLSTSKWKGKDVEEIDVLGVKVPIDNYLELLGFLISEGCIYYNEKTYDYSVSINQKIDSSCLPNIKSSIEKFAELLNIHIGKNTKENNVGFSENKPSIMKEWRITRKALTKHFLDEIGAGAYNKKIPNWVKQLPPRRLEVLIKSLRAGDGQIFKPNGIRKDSTGFRYDTASKQLADDVQEILFKCGFAPRLSAYIHSESKKKYYFISWSTSNYGKTPIIYGNRKNKGNGGGATFDKFYYEGKVVCFSVPNELLVTRRNGLISIQGNCKFAQADGLINPITVVKLGGNTDGEYRATQEDIEEFKHIMEQAQFDKDFKLITHAGVTIERVGAAGSVIDISSDIDLIIKNIYTGLMIPPAVVDTESAAYSSASIGLEVLRQRYFNFRNVMARWLQQKLFAPISKIQKFYKKEKGYNKLIIPEVEWNQMNLYDLQDYISNITGLVSQRQASLQTLYRSLGLNYEEERVRMRQEMINDAVRTREEQALMRMNLDELRTLDPEKPIQEPADDLQRQPQGAAPGAMPGGEMGMGLPGGDMGGLGGGLGGGLPGGGLPGGGLGELAPPPGGPVEIGPSPAGEAGPVPPLGPGTPTPEGGPGV